MRVQDEITHYDEFFMDDAEIAVVAFGGTARTAYAAVEAARRAGQKVGMIRIMTIWPFADKVMQKLAQRVKGILVPEMNYGQYVREVERAVAGMAHVVSLPKYNTEVFTPDEIKQGIEKLAAEVSR